MRSPFPRARRLTCPAIAATDQPGKATRDEREKETHLWTNHFRTGAFTHDGNTLPAAGAERVTQAENVKSKPSINRGPSK